jgi:hypothetical protein
MSEPSDHEWLLARERGENVLQVPAKTRTKYQQLDQLIAALPGRAPSPGWKQRMLDLLEEPTPAPVARPRWRMQRIAGGVALAAAAVVVLAVYSTRTDRRMTEPVVATEVRRGTNPHRGSGVSIGDTFVVHVEVDRAIELRVYGDAGEPLARCTDDQGCTVQRDGERRRYSLEVTLHAQGEVRAVLFMGATATAPPPKNLDADLEAAHQAGVDARQIAVLRAQ